MRGCAWVCEGEQTDVRPVGTTGFAARIAPVATTTIDDDDRPQWGSGHETAIHRATRQRRRPLTNGFPAILSRARINSVCASALARIGPSPRTSDEEPAVSSHGSDVGPGRLTPQRQRANLVGREGRGREHCVLVHVWPAKCSLDSRSGVWNCLSRNRNEWGRARKAIDRNLSDWHPPRPAQHDSYESYDDNSLHGDVLVLSLVQHSAFSIQHSAFSIQHSAFSIQLYSFSAVEWTWPRMAQSTSCRGALKCAWMPCSSSLLVTWTRTGA